MTKLFGTNGVRGTVGSTMTPDVALRLGLAVGTWLKPGDRMTVGSDARASGPHLKAAFCAGVNATGVHTVDIGVLPSPGIQLYVRDRRFAAGAIVTASHNPPEYNGIKLVAPDGTETSQAEEAVVEGHYAKQDFRRPDWKGIGTHSTDDGAVAHYLQAVLQQVDAKAIRAAKLKVVLDPGGGAGCVTAPKLLDALGVEVVPLSTTLDGAFRDRPSEPSPQNATRAIAAVKASKASLGVLQDGDADRAVFIDETGGYVWGDKSLALAALHELRRHGKPGAVVCTAVSSSSCVADAVKMAGGKLEWTIVGSPVVAREMLRVGAVFGGEDNGGLMFARHQVCRDGLMALAFMLELLAKTGQPFSKLVAEIPSYALVKDKLQVPDAAKQATLAALREAVGREAGVVSVDARDGVKVYTKEGWALVRPSGTEPIFRIQAEAKTEAEAQALVARFKALLERTMLATAR
ncbi:MAG: phosphomannomutase / phosphoglucomutase [Thermoplasmata archaeon]|jgi:phosphomannomutase/phosphoglucomutase|nr:phosphomannomutase / phosphoglucomutase [Thermoplasmata archaeon]